MPAWLVKTEPNEYSYDDLVRDGDAEWDGVTNAQAQINLRSMQVGDPIVVYHSGGEKSAIGLARVVKGPSPDPTDPAGKRVWVYLRAERRLDRAVRYVGRAESASPAEGWAEAHAAEQRRIISEVLDAG